MNNVSFFCLTACLTWDASGAEMVTGGKRIRQVYQKGNPCSESYPVGQTLTQLCGLFDMSRQAVTKHLCLLEAANLVTTVWDGREKLHYLNPVPIHEISERWIGKYERHRLQALSDLKKGLEQNENKKG